MLPQEVIKDDVVMMKVARDNAAGSKIFDINTTDAEELVFLENVIENEQKPSYFDTD